MSRTFAGLFGTAPEYAADAPGRVNLIGEHTDYNDGFVLPAALPLRTYVQLSRTGGDRIRAWSAAFPADAPAVFPLGVGDTQNDWVDYVRGITSVLRGFGVDSGYDVRIESHVPLGSGLSSSASLLVALARVLRAAYALPLDDLQVAVLARRAETDFVGAPVGIMDQMACSLADDASALFIDTRSLEFSRVPLPDSAGLIVIDSGIRHAHATGEYRTRRDECRRAAAALGVATLREITTADLDRISALPSPLDRRARHVVTENGRVLAAVEALRAGALDRVGELFRASHASMRDDYEVSTPEIDALVAIADRVQGVYGARLTGGGFGGAIVALADRANARSAADHIVQQYQERHGWGARVIVPAA